MNPEGLMQRVHRVFPLTILKLPSNTGLGRIFLLLLLLIIIIIIIIKYYGRLFGLGVSVCDY